MPAFVKVVWHHDLVDEPVVLCSELDGDRYEIRKVEVFRDGRRVCADSGGATGDCALGEIPVPSVPDLEAAGEFSAVEVGEREFEVEWAAAHGGRWPPPDLGG